MRQLSESFRSPSSASHLFVLGAAYASLSEVARRSGQHDARIMPGSEGLARSCRLSAQVEGLQVLAHFAKPLRKPFISGKIDAFTEIMTTLQQQPGSVDVGFAVLYQSRSEERRRGQEGGGRGRVRRAPHQK